MGGLQLNNVQNHKAIFRLLPTAAKDMHMKFETEILKQTWVMQNHAIQKPKNLIRPPGSHLENEVTEIQ